MKAMVFGLCVILIAMIGGWNWTMKEMEKQEPLWKQSATDATNALNEMTEYLEELQDNYQQNRF